jgi:hypothetical protein
MLLAREADARLDVLVELRAALNVAGVRWAHQGGTGASTAWLSAQGPAYLDIWVEHLPAEVADLLDGLAGARIADTSDPRRLRHVTWALLLPGGPVVVDLTVGDLRVGSVLLVPSDEVRVIRAGGVNRLTGQAAVADLLARPVLRGQAPNDARLAEAQQAWNDIDDDERSRLTGRLGDKGGRLTGRTLATGLVQLAEGRTGTRPDDTRRLLRAARRMMVRTTISWLSLRSSWGQLHAMLPIGPSPFGHRVRGVVVVLVGTDGCGRSAVQSELCDRLERAGVSTRAAATRSSTHPRRRRAAAWLYSAAHAWRWLRLVGPGLARGRVVVCDGWVRTPAAAFAERLLPAPDVLVLLGAPDAVLHAAEECAWFATVVVRAPQRAPDLSELVSTVLAAMHRVPVHPVQVLRPPRHRAGVDPTS